MRLVFLLPPFPSNRRHKKVIPLGVCYLSSFLKSKLSWVKIGVIDAHLYNLSFPEVLKKIKEFKPDVLALSYWSLQAEFAYKLYGEVKKIDKRIIVISGGVHPTAIPQEASLYSDFVVLSEGEITFYELLKALLEKRQNFYNIEGIAYRKGKDFIKTLPRQFIQDLDTLPFPDLDLVDIYKYDTPFHVLGGRRIPVIGSRGCPFNCIFCGSPSFWRRKLRFRNPLKVVEEIALIKDKYKIDKIHFWDDNLILNREYFQGLCEGIIKASLKVAWIGLSRSTDIIKNRDLLKLAKESGCVGIEIGIESANPLTYISTQKNEALENIREAAYLQEKHGLVPLYTFMCFNPEEKTSSYYFLKKFIEEISPLSYRFQAFHSLPFRVYIGQFATPHAGTEFERRKEEFGEMIDSSWVSRYHHVINFLPHSLLKDIPCKLSKRLSLDDKFVSLQVYKTSLWNEIPPYTPMRKRLYKEYRYLKFLENFYQEMDGKSSFKQIAQKLSWKLKLEKKTAFQYAAISIVVLSQLGLIKSRDFSLTPEREKFLLPGKLKRLRKYLFFKCLGPFLNFFKD